MPPRTDPRWAEVIDQPTAHAYAFLALRIFMQRIVGKGTLSASERSAAIDDLYSLFQKNERLMAADITAIFG